MATILFNDLLHSAPQTSVAGGEGFGLWVKAVCYSVRHATDGFVPAGVFTLWNATEEGPRGALRAGLLARAKGGWRVLNPVLRGNRKPCFKVEVPQSRADIPAAVRLAVYARDGHQCVLCAATDDLTLDHIYPWSLGGPDTEENLRVLCRSCNSRKGARVG